ncbi:MAG: 50S ribosomal protein L36 [Rickettsiaceae bacterium H1]|nr:50S ribosomal protein L36 [Rickettsiaceae bacterium H1]
MKTYSSLKSAKNRDKRNTYLAKRGKRIYVCNKKNPRVKARQGK